MTIVSIDTDTPETLGSPVLESAVLGSPVLGSPVLGSPVLESAVLESAVLADIYRMHGRSVHKYLLTLTNGDAQLAEDILQETFLRAWRTPRLAHRPEAARPWLVTVARNLVVDRVRYRNRRPQEAGDGALAHIPTTRCEISRVVDSITLAEAMAKLTPTRREVVVHMYLHGRSPDEVSAVLGIPVGTVKSRVHSALRSLRTHLATSELCLAA